MSPPRSEEGSCALRPVAPAARSPAHARPLRAWSRRDREEVGRAFGETLRAWADGWGIPDPAASGAGVACEPWCERSPPAPDVDGWEPLGEARSGLLWRLEPRAEGRDARSLERLESAIFRVRQGATRRDGPSGAGTLASSVAADAQADLLSRLAGDLGGYGPRDDVAPSRWAGALVVSAGLCGCTLFVRISGERVAAVLRRTTARAPAPAGGLTPIWTAMRAHRLRLEAHLGSFEVEIGSLEDLQLGDVLCTRHSLDIPLELHLLRAPGEAPQPIGSAYLGRCGASRALELLRAHPKHPVEPAPQSSCPSPEHRTQPSGAAHSSAARR